MTRPDKGETMNPNGRPRKLVSKIIDDLKMDGVEAVTSSNVSDAISVLIGLPKGELLILSIDEDCPVLIQRTAKRLASSTDKDWDNIIKDNLDRAHGKATQRQEITGRDNAPIRFQNVSDTDLDKALSILENGGKK